MFGWMRYFFTEDVSPDNHPIIDLQRRASWLCIAFVLQALNEINPKLYLSVVPFLEPWGGVIPFLLVGGSFVAMWMAFRPEPAQQRGKESLLQRHEMRPRRWQRIVLVCAMLASIAGGIELGRSVVMSFFLPPQYTNDGTSLDTNAAMLLLEGHNPYTDSSILNLVRRFSIQPDWTTPLKQGQFADQAEYPSSSALRSVLDTDLKAGAAPEFESKVSYPALSFLTLVPFILLNISNVLPFYLLSYLLIVAIGWKVVRSEMRPWLLLFSLANVSMWTSVVGGNLDIFYTLLIVLAWLLREQSWWSAICLGLALASKQIAWFFVPFYALMAWRQHNLAEAVRRLTIAGVIALAINLPFILWNPQAWLAGVLAPVADPMFPLGVGLVSLGQTPLLPILPPAVYAILEGIALLLALAWYWRLCKGHPEAAMLLAVLPLFFAWRSLPSYFYCSAFPLFILLAARALPGRKFPLGRVLARVGHLLFDDDLAVVGEFPAGIGSRAAMQSLRFFGGSRMHGL